MPTTLLELVEAVSKFCSTEEEVVAVVKHLLVTRRVRLVGSFRGAAWA